MIRIALIGILSLLLTWIIVSVAIKYLHFAAAWSAGQ